MSDTATFWSMRVGLALVLMLVLASPFAQGGETLVGQGLVIVAGATGFAVMALAAPFVWLKEMTWIATCWAGLIGWCLIQATPLGIALHPVWNAAAPVLGEPLAGSIALDPQAATDAAARLAAYAGLFAAGVTAAHFGHTVWVWNGLALGVAAIAASALFAADWDVGPAGLAKVRHWGDLAFPFANRNHFCVFAGIGALATLPGLIGGRQHRLWLKGLLAGALLVCLAAAFATHSRAGLASIAAGGFVTFALALPRRRALLVVTVAAGTSALFALAFAAGTLVRLDTLAEAMSLRLAIIAAAFEFALQRPLLGAGSFDLAFQAVAPAFPQGLVQSAHNVMAESLVERGWPATGLAVVALLLALLQCTRALVLGGIGRFCAAAAIGIATLTMLHGTVDFSLHAPSVAALVALTLGLGAGLASHRGAMVSSFAPPTSYQPDGARL